MSKLTIKSLIKKIRNETKRHGNTRGRVADVLDGLNDYKADLVDGKVPLEQLPEFPDTGIKSVREGQNITIDNTDPLNPVVSAQLPEIPDQGIRTIQEGLNIKVDNTDPLNPVVSAQASSFEGIETSDSATVAFTGDGTEDNPLTAESAETLESVALRGSHSPVPISAGEEYYKFGIDTPSNTRYIGGGTGPNYTGNRNVIIGTDLPNITTATENVAIGQFALEDVISSPYNFALGYAALQKQISGLGNNTAIGAGALRYCTTGWANLAIGSGQTQAGPGQFYDGVSVHTGKHNISVGIGTLNNISGGARNTAIGNGAASYAESALDNTIIGYLAGSGLRAGRGNLFIGAGAGGSRVDSPDYSNKLCIEQVIYSHVSGFWSTGGTPLNDYKKGLISGDFAVREVNIDGKFSVTPTRMPASDSTYTKNIVAKPDGTFGWEDKQSSTAPNLQQVTTAGNVTTVDEIKMGYIENGTRLFSFSNRSVGFGGLPKTATGDLNTVMGDLSGVGIQSAARSTLIGGLAGWNMVSGYNNTIVGFDFYGSLLTGERNTLIGSEFKCPPNSFESSSIGYATTVGTTAVAIGSRTKASDKSVSIGWGVNSQFARESPNSVLIGHYVQGITSTTQYSNLLGIGNLIGAYGTAAGQNIAPNDPNAFKSDGEMIINNYTSQTDFSEPLIRGNSTPGAKYLKVANKLGVNFAFTETLNSNFNVKGSESSTITTINSATTLDSHRYIIANGSSYLITLPAASTCKGRKYTIKTIGTGITISSFKNISNVDTTTLAQNTSITLISDGTVWQEF